MKLLHLAEGRKHIVWAVCDEDGACQTLDALMRAAEEHADLADEIMALLFEEVPNNGPPLKDVRRAKKLYRDILYELKADKGSGRKEHLGLRIAFFFDGPIVIVCTNAFYKGHGTPPEDLERAKEARAMYFAAKRRNQLDFESIEGQKND